MKTIAVISQKGGAGKTTLTVHLAAEAAAAGQNVVIIDLDPQASSANWGDRREQATPVVIPVFATRLPQEIERVREAGCDVCFIDTAPHADAVAVAAAKAADVAVIPCRANAMDVEAAGTTIELVKTTGTPLFVALNAVVPGSGETDAAEAAIRDNYQVNVCPARLTNRVVFARSIGFGMVAQEFEPDSKAAQEIKALYACTMNIVNTATIQQANTDPAQEVNHAQA